MREIYSRIYVLMSLSYISITNHLKMHAHKCWLFSVIMTFVQIKRDNVCKMLSIKYLAWHTVDAQEYNLFIPQTHQA